MFPTCSTPANVGHSTPGRATAPVHARTGAAMVRPAPCGAPLNLTGPTRLSAVRGGVLLASPTWSRREAAAGPLGRQPQVDEVGADDVVDARVALQRRRVLRPFDRQQAPGERLRQVHAGLVGGGGITRDRNSERRRKPLHLSYVR